MAFYTYARGPEHTDASYLTGVPASGTHLEVWTASSGGTQITALKTLAGSALPGYVTVDSFGRYEFRIESQAYPAVWMKDPSAKFWQVLASEVLPQVPAAITNAAAAVAANASRLDITEAPLSPLRYGALGSGAALQAAFTAAAAATGGSVLIPASTWTNTGNLTVASSVKISGEGDRTYLAFTNGGLLYDGSAGYLTEVGLHDLRITRTGTAGAALRLKGGGPGTGVAHFNVSDVNIVGSTGECLLIDGSYIGDFVGCYFVAGVTGIKIAYDSVAGTVSGNSISFYGGETQGCGTAASLNTPLGVSFHGHTFEGSTAAGIDLFGNGYGVGFYDCYWESNAGYDLRVGNSGSVGPSGLVVHGGAALDGSGGKTRAFQLIRGLGIDIRAVGFNGYGGAPIEVNEASAGLVRGRAQECIHDGSAANPIVAYTAATKFNTTILGQNDETATVAGTPITLHKQYIITQDFGSIAAGTTADAALTATGVAVGDDVTVHLNSSLEAGLMCHAVATATNTITLRVANVTTGAIDPAVRNWRFRVWR